MIQVEAFGPDGQPIAADVTPGPVRAAVPRSRWSDDAGPTTVEQIEARRRFYFHAGGRKNGKSAAYAAMAEAIRTGSVRYPTAADLKCAFYEFRA